MDKKEALKKVQESGSELGNLPDEFKIDKDVVLAAVKQDGGALQYADDSLKKDKEIVLIAVKQYGSFRENEKHAAPAARLCLGN